MKIYPKKEEKSEEGNFDHLTPLEKFTRKSALVVAFISVFFFFFKILFL
ncbi:hypothetical protein [Dyadobacter sp. CY356]|nr:hypothetical protein [Dyadobacter sp. CY356]MCF0055788.1 hypothetical protein [Dyadobacter sp. CY356]